MRVLRVVVTATVHVRRQLLPTSLSRLSRRSIQPSFTLGCSTLRRPLCLLLMRLIVVVVVLVVEAVVSSAVSAKQL